MIDAMHAYSHCSLVFLNIPTRVYSAGGEGGGGETSIEIKALCNRSNLRLAQICSHFFFFLYFRKKRKKGERQIKLINGYGADDA